MLTARITRKLLKDERFASATFEGDVEMGYAEFNTGRSAGLPKKCRAKKVPQGKKGKRKQSCCNRLSRFATRCLTDPD